MGLLFTKKGANGRTEAEGEERGKRKVICVYVPQKQMIRASRKMVDECLH